MKIVKFLKSSRFRVGATGAMCLLMAACEPCCDADNCDPPYFINDPKARVFVADEDFSAFNGADTPSVSKAIKGLTQTDSIALWLPRAVEDGCGDCPKLFYVQSGALRVLDIPAGSTTPVSRPVNLSGSAVSAIAWDRAPSGFIWATSPGMVIQVDGRAESVAFRLQLPGRTPTLIAMQESQSPKGVVLSGNTLVTFDSFGERASANVGTNISDIAINNAYIVAVSLFNSKMFIFDSDLKNMKTIDIQTPHHVALRRQQSTMAFVSAIRQGQSGVVPGVIVAVDVKALTVSTPVLVGACPADVQLFENGGTDLGFVSNECDNTVSKFKLTSPPEVIQAVPVGYGPGYLAVHP